MTENERLTVQQQKHDGPQTRTPNVSEVAPNMLKGRTAYSEESQADFSERTLMYSVVSIHSSYLCPTESELFPWYDVDISFPEFARNIALAVFHFCFMFQLYDPLFGFVLGGNHSKVCNEASHQNHKCAEASSEADG